MSSATTPPNPETGSPPDPRYGYFVLQTLSRGDGISGVVEDLTNGNKQRFESADGLAGLVQDWGNRTRKAP